MELEDGQNRVGGWLEQSWRMVGTESEDGWNRVRGWLEQSWRSGRGSILDQTESQQSDGDLNNLTLLQSQGHL